jgi:heme/copper-type cytochrome/quinol oxidase subunit 2
MLSHLADAIFWIAVACCTIAQVAILVSVVASPVKLADAPARPSFARRTSEVAWAVLPGVALAFVLVFTWRAMHGGSL